MTWEYGVIGLVIGLISGVVATRFGSRKLRDQHAVQYELEKTKDELKELKQELNSHFTRSSGLLDTMAQNYRELCELMASDSRTLLPEQPDQNNTFIWQQADKYAYQEQPSLEMPRDYSGEASGLLRSRPTDKK